MGECTKKKSALSISGQTSLRILSHRAGGAPFRQHSTISEVLNPAVGQHNSPCSTWHIHGHVVQKTEFTTWMDDVIKTENNQDEKRAWV
ncbi:hypothetical protein CEXT_518001 [Caerostris extrusa]|uniref:Uncharacterized protein n=1 Tax=Caerostris extrusa TaxID=172846 RepID=A0AAV4SFT7_CAEEX|nr:hypothetical protein CEXT_518001 [Caerostris extrusa]